MKPLLTLLIASSTLAARLTAALPQPTTWNIDGVERKALVFAPTAKTPSGQHPVIFAFHGHGGNMRGVSQWGLQNRWPAAIVVYPQGLPTPSKRDPEGQKNGWLITAGSEANRDLKFLDAMLATVREQYRVDNRRIFSTGFSNGAFFSLFLWNQRSDVFAGFAIVAGALPPSMHLPVAKPVLHIAGEKDPLVTFDKTTATIAEERRIDQATGAGESCGEGCTLYRGEKAEVKVAIHPAGHVYPAFASEMTVEFLKGLNAPPHTAKLKR